MEKVPFPRVEELRLDNGLPVYNVPFGTQEIVEINLVFPGGRSFEPAPAISSFTVKMMQEGTKAYSGLEYARKLDEYGAFVHTDIGYESATIGLTTLAKHLHSTIPLLREVVMHPTFPEKDLEKLRSRTLQHLDVEEKKTGYNARKQFNRLLFGTAHPYGRTAEKEDVERIALNDLRAFHDRNFNLANCFIIMSGRFNVEKMMAVLNAHFGKSALTDPAKRVLPEESHSAMPMGPHATGYQYFRMPDTMQATVRVGHQSFQRNHPDYYRMQVVTTILGGYFGSRLMKNIREDKGYTYGIGSAWLCMKYNGLFIIQSDVGNEYVEPTLKEIRKEVRRLIDVGATEEEVSLVKNYMLGRSASARETPSQIANLIRSTLVNGGRFSDLDDKFDIIKQVKPEDIRELAEQYLRPEKMLEVVCGNLDL